MNMTRLRYDWYDKNDGKIMTGQTHNIKFVREDEGMKTSIVTVTGKTIHSMIVNHQEELNLILDKFFELNQFTTNNNITKG
jgi:hypothetical protein